MENKTDSKTSDDKVVASRNTSEDKSTKKSKNEKKKDLGTSTCLSDGPEIVYNVPIQERNETVSLGSKNESLKSLLSEPGERNPKVASRPGAFAMQPTRERGTSIESLHDVDDIEDAVAVPARILKTDPYDSDPSQQDLDSSRKLVVEATMVDDDYYAEATPIDPTLEKMERDKAVQDLVLKEREEIIKTTSRKSKRKFRFLIALVVFVTIAAACTIAVLSLRKKDSIPTPPSLMELKGDKIQVSAVADAGRSFHVPVSDFIFPLDQIEADGTSVKKSTLRVWNSRTKTTKAIMVELKSDNLVYGWYNPANSGQPDDFQVGDILTAVDYSVFQDSQKCKRVPFNIKLLTSSAWNQLPENTIRIGRDGLVGPQRSDPDALYEFEDFDNIIVHTLEPVSKIWTDAIDVIVEVIQPGSWASWPKELKPSTEDSSIRNFQSPLSGSIRICLKNMGIDVLNGLVSKSDGGGLHLAFCS